MFLVQYLLKIAVANNSMMDETDKHAEDLRELDFTLLKKNHTFVTSMTKYGSFAIVT